MKKLKVLLIRHGKTRGNQLGKYIGARTDEGLCKEGREGLLGGVFPKADYVYSSPMKRCKETAALLYPGVPVCCQELLRECDFGLFENKSYEELTGNPRYQAWIDSQGTLPFPEGESGEAFRKRCAEGFAWCVEDAFQKKFREVAVVAHGGTIMSILFAFGTPGGQYFEWQIQNGAYYELMLDHTLWKQERRISEIRKGQYFNE